MTLKTNDRYGMGVITVGCEKCGLIQTNPRPTEHGLSDFYKNDYRKFYQNTVHPSLEYIQKNNKHTRMAYTVNFLMKTIEHRSIHKVLDIGCSEGAFFSALKERGYSGELYGVEPNREFALFTEQQTGAKVFPSIETLEGKFDLIVLTHVFEHFLSPDIFLQRIKTNLNVDGLLYIDVPDAAEYSSLADLHIAHLYHFTANTLAELMRANGFQVLECDRHRPPHHPRSVRVVAIQSQQPLPGTILTTAQTESEIWTRIRKIGVYKYLLRRKLASIKLLRAMYRFAVR